MKEKAEHYKGIEFIRISKLPLAQRDQLASTMARENIIKILMDKELVVDCVQYKHYSTWYDAHHSVQAQVATPPRENTKESKPSVRVSFSS
ncbi:MAG: hypothetical protein RLN86_05270 [Cyclobacteriaceae bacterium]